MTKRIVVCCDGTWNTPDQQEDGQVCPTNVVKMASAIVPEDAHGTAQIVFYHSGYYHWRESKPISSLRK